ncbi:MAG TPA: HdeD family acid-resistance protein [Dongiaceae bacterium]|jgi:uncharacterized membrane protein HdeD (DUF308 family)|nr:HdeD family acid-resistance protein [Dongiaceae bacterium]
MATYIPGDDRRHEPPLSDAMSALLARNWWAVLLRGALAILLGVLALLMPVVSLASLVLLFAIYMLADGVLGIISAVRAARQDERWGWLVFEGLLDIAAGIAAFVWPGITILVFVALVAAWAVATGGAMLGAAFRLKKGHGNWLMGLAGVLSVIWGILLILAPITGAVVLTLWIGAYALVFGIALVALSFRLRSRRSP